MEVSATLSKLALAGLFLILIGGCVRAPQPIVVCMDHCACDCGKSNKRAFDHIDMKDPRDRHVRTNKIPNNLSLNVANLNDIPSNKIELMDECSFINNEIDRISNFADRMSKSRFSMYYLAHSQKQLSKYESRELLLGCQQFEL